MSQEFTSGFFYGWLVTAVAVLAALVYRRLTRSVDADERAHQFHLLRQQILEDARWMAHDPKVAPVCERYARMAGKDWKNYAPESASNFRRRIGCEPTWGGKAHAPGDVTVPAECQRCTMRHPQTGACCGVYRKPADDVRASQAPSFADWVQTDPVARAHADSSRDLALIEHGWRGRAAAGVGASRGKTEATR